MRRTLTTVFGFGSAGLGVMIGVVSGIGLVAVLALPGLSTEQLGIYLVKYVLALIGSCGVFGSGILLLLRSKYTATVLVGTLVAALLHSAWVLACIPMPVREGATPTYATGHAIGRFAGLAFVPGLCTALLAYLRSPKTRVEFGRLAPGGDPQA